MQITADVQWFISVLLASIRVGAVFLFSPIFSLTGAPIQFRVLLVLGLSALLVTSLGLHPAIAPTGLGELLQYSSHELLIGLTLAFGVFAAFASFLLGGRILDFQMGFGVANLIDPATNTQTAMMGVVLNMIAVMIFFLVNGHHMLIRGLAYSFDKVPLGQALGQLNIDAVVAQFGYMFTFSVMAVAPALFAILLLDIGLAVMARTMPQVNIFFISIPLKIFVGLFITAISMRYIWPLMEKVFSSIFQYWEQVLV
jgi:flagellar biosynthetic protein FliR